MGTINVREYQIELREKDIEIALTWIICKLGWKVGNGMSIRLGIDFIGGFNVSYQFFDGLGEYFCDFGITHLVQAQNLDFETNSHEYCYTATNLNLGGI